MRNHRDISQIVSPQPRNRLGTVLPVFFEISAHRSLCLRSRSSAGFSPLQQQGTWLHKHSTNINPSSLVPLDALPAPNVSPAPHLSPRRPDTIGVWRKPYTCLTAIKRNECRKYLIQSPNSTRP